MDIWLIVAAVCFAVEAVWHKNLLSAGLFFWVLSFLI